MTEPEKTTRKEIEGLLDPVPDAVAEAPERKLDYSQFPGRIHSGS